MSWFCADSHFACRGMSVTFPSVLFSICFLVRYQQRVFSAASLCFICPLADRPFRGQRFLTSNLQQQHCSVNKRQNGHPSVLLSHPLIIRVYFYISLSRLPDQATGCSSSFLYMSRRRRQLEREECRKEIKLDTDLNKNLTKKIKLYFES